MFMIINDISNKSEPHTIPPIGVISGDYENGTVFYNAAYPTQHFIKFHGGLLELDVDNNSDPVVYVNEEILDRGLLSSVGLVATARNITLTIGN